MFKLPKKGSKKQMEKIVNFFLKNFDHKNPVISIFCIDYLFDNHSDIILNVFLKDKKIH